jgi:uncharacterized membrane protein
MNLIGPKSISSKLLWVSRVAFYLAALGVLLMAMAPLFPNNLSLHNLSFNLDAGPLNLDMPMLHGEEARWWIWRMELVRRICLAAVLYLLMRILEPAKTGELFHLKTPMRLRMMGCTVIIRSVLETFFCRAILSKRIFFESGASVRWQIDENTIFIGIVLIVLGEIFRRGYALKTESELTV